MAHASDSNEMHKAMFVNLIMMLSSSAMQQMGKLVDPASGKAAADLQSAQMTIDLLDMLRAKTKGNLDHQEESLLVGTLSSLQLTYVETAGEQPAADEKTNDKAAGAAPGPETAPAAGEAGEVKVRDRNDPKYHKAYG